MKMKLIITRGNVGRLAAACVRDRINKFKPSAGRPFVIALPTGGTAVEMYKNLVAFYKAGELSFKNVVSFNLDEYVNFDPAHPESYHGFMRRNLFEHVDMQPQNINIPDGNAPSADAFCAAYEAKIKELGGIELFLGGVGANGHIAFNEPGSAFDSRTRVVNLQEKTLKDNARFFGGDINAVPKQAITMGVGTILEARHILIMAAGANKARAVRAAVEGKPDTMWTISALQAHKDAILLTDEEAASLISADKAYETVLS
ncbi:MAG: glucosamine-6-phosphate deaminase [Elusimicrobiota bacterium]|jgi:glucosamine-6-phosphate deaminase|nr:glucosamine-6-phosphate deaminase [Elusimicrobiota bacterium]